MAVDEPRGAICVRRRRAWARCKQSLEGRLADAEADAEGSREGRQALLETMEKAKAELARVNEKKQAMDAQARALDESVRAAAQQSEDAAGEAQRARPA